jgi:N-methylhydantoinase A
VTDANLVLGRLNADHFLGGEMKLNVDAARRAIEQRIAAPLGYTGENGMIEMADGIISIATVIMAGAIRRISVGQGLDPRDFVLFTYGGGGPLHSCALAHELSIPMIVIPPEPGNFSATGMLLADGRIDSSNTFVHLLDDSSVTAMREAFTAMEKKGCGALAAEFGTGDIFFERHAEMRYRGQRHNIKVPVSKLNDAVSVRAAFERDYKRRYGHADSNAPAEFQTLHLSAFARLQRPEIARLPRSATQKKPAQSRRIYIGSAGGWLEANIFNRNFSRRDLPVPDRPLLRSTVQRRWSGPATASRSAPCMRSGSTVRGFKRGGSMIREVTCCGLTGLFLLLLRTYSRFLTCLRHACSTGSV